MTTTTVPVRWFDDLNADFDQCPDAMKEVPRNVLHDMGVPAKGEMADGWRKVAAAALVCYCRGGDKLRGTVLGGSGEPIRYLPEGNLSKRVWDAVWDALVAVYGRRV